jgi:hypothetical protein
MTARELQVLREQEANERRVVAESLGAETPAEILNNVLTTLMLKRDMAVDRRYVAVTLDMADMNMLIDRLNDVREHFDLEAEINGAPNRFVLRVRRIEKSVEALIKAQGGLR